MTTGKKYVFQDSCDMYVAHDFDELHRLRAEMDSESRDDEWEQLADDVLVEFWTEYGHGDRLIKTAGEWAAAREPGHLCSTEY